MTLNFKIGHGNLHRLARSLAAPAAALGVLAVPPAVPTAQAQATAGHMVFQVKVDAPIEGPVSGRLILMAQSWEDAQESPVNAIIGPKPDPARPNAVFVAAKEIRGVQPGQTIDIDADALAFPEGFSKLTAGPYLIQAILDVDGNFAYSNYAWDGDLFGAPVRMELPAGRTTFSLNRIAAPRRPWSSGGEQTEAARKDTRPMEFLSPSLSAFWGKPTYVRGWVLLPPGYDQGAGRYPTVYRTEGFGATLAGTAGQLGVAEVHRAMASGASPPMIWVFLDHSGPTGTHEFADSANNGPWGKALTEELIPWLETQYRMDARPSGRFLTGHSSGGWMALWTQVRYPKLFGGAWPTAPDPVDFHEFTNIDIYARGANAYRRPDGAPTPLIRRGGEVVGTFQNYAQLEDVLGDQGGQIDSFDWVFSPKGRDGRPRPLFDRRTGAVDPQVAAYWRDNYDITHRIRTNWPALKSDLDGKIHLSVGTEDTFYLDRGARRLKAVLDELGAKADFRFIEGRDHATLAFQGRDPFALDKTIAWEMYAVARPEVMRPQASVRVQEQSRQCGTSEIPTPPTQFFDPARYDPASLRPDQSEIKDGRGVVVGLIQRNGLLLLPVEGSPFYGSEGELIGTLIIDPVCGDPKIASPTTPRTPGSWLMRNRDGKYVVRPRVPEKGDTFIARF